MNIILEKYNNLIYSIFMHFGFNIVYVFLDADIGFFIILTLLYMLITPIAIYFRNKRVKAYN
ncbi:abortive infection protein [Streptococcus dysgalactiae]|nr:abortive infection protein [Streptococcus dysgalactiae]